MLLMRIGMMGYMLLVTQFAHAIYSRQKLPHNYYCDTYIHPGCIHPHNVGTLSSLQNTCSLVP